MNTSSHGLESTLLMRAEGELRDHYRLLCAQAGDILRFDTRTGHNSQHLQMRDILEKLLRRAEQNIVHHLSDHLITLPEIRRDAILHLARADLYVVDDECARAHFPHNVGLAEYVTCCVFDHEMWQTIRTLKSRHDLAINSEHGKSGSIGDLIASPDVAISTAASGYLAEEALDIDCRGAPILHYKSLPRRLSLPVYWWIAAELRRWLVQNTQFSLADLDDAIERAVHMISAQPIVDHESGRVLVEHLEMRHELNEDLLISFLRDGHVSLFFIGLAQHLHCDALVVRRIFSSAGTEVFSAMCRAASLSQTAYMTLFHLRRQVMKRSIKLTETQQNELKNFYAALDREPAEMMLRCWSRDPSYIAAINFSETGRALESMPETKKLPE